MKPKKISSSEAKHLSASFSLEEIYKAMQSLDSKKAPGPDGLNGSFVKFSWDFMKEKFMQMVGILQNTGLLSRGLNSSLIALIPKIEAPRFTSEFRPISLINFTMKILLKAMANRLGRVMGSIVSGHQTAFIKGRNISEGIFLASEISHSIINKKCRGVILKIDFAKAFDTVSWNFLEEAMKAMNFVQKWCFWIKSILQSTRPSILINVSPTPEIEMKSGLRQ